MEGEYRPRTRYADSIDDVLAAAIAAQASPLLGVPRMLFRLIGANMNVTTDQELVKLHSFGSFILTNWYYANPSIVIGTALGGVYSAAAKGGKVLVSASAGYNAAAGDGGALTPQPTTGRGVLLGTTQAFLSLSTPQGAAATCDIYGFGFGVS